MVLKLDTSGSVLHSLYMYKLHVAAVGPPHTPGTYYQTAPVQILLWTHTYVLQVWRQIGGLVHTTSTWVDGNGGR